LAGFEGPFRGGEKRQETGGRARKGKEGKGRRGWETPPK